MQEFINFATVLVVAVCVAGMISTLYASGLRGASTAKAMRALCRAWGRLSASLVACLSCCSRCGL